MKNPNQILRLTPHRRRRREAAPAFPHKEIARTLTTHDQPRPANDLLVLCYYPGMKPVHPTAA